MSDTTPRYVQIDNWIFELKMVRALKVDEYGKPYSAIANCNINGENMYVDGLLTKEDEGISKEDFLTFLKFSKQLGLKGFSYHRYHNGESSVKDAHIDKLDSYEDFEAPEEKVETQQTIRLVK
ncbi:hypothetical protein [Thalassotalea piscium]|uniref:Uncharacterized protein n=1 Tax=Thalassotalea piscium TaxID=1230533 RepID=A0A7X0TRZ3_9GAMM|nr:hypothetical protein [Thalassotalea piscium]MBB6541591.1 hypothetical protein [Thalassotalea piscium]